MTKKKGEKEDSKQKYQEEGLLNEAQIKLILFSFLYWAISAPIIIAVIMALKFINMEKQITSIITIFIIGLIVAIYIALAARKYYLESHCTKKKVLVKKGFVRVCPKCGGTDISHDLSVRSYGRGSFFNEKKCNICGYMGQFFPEVEKSKKKFVKVCPRCGSTKTDCFTGMYTPGGDVLGDFCKDCGYGRPYGTNLPEVEKSKLAQFRKQIKKRKKK